jgi:beta-galactosidase
VALIADWNNWWALEQESHPSADLDHTDTLLHHYRPFFEAGVACDIVPPDRDLAAYKLVVVPNLYLLSEETAARLTEFVRGGGQLLVSYFTGIVDDCDRIHLGGYPARLRELLGLTVEEFWPLAEGRSTAIRGGLTGSAELWSEHIRTEGAETVAEFGDGELAGRPAVTRHDFGAGAAWYAGARLDPAAMRALTDRIRAEADARPVLPDLPAQVQATVREGAGGRYLFLLNHGETTADVPLPGPMRDLLDGGEERVDAIALRGRGVAVLRQ